MAPAITRTAELGDVEGILRLQAVSYPVLVEFSQWRREHLESHLRTFPEGQFVAVDDGRIVGYSACLIVSSKRAFRPHSFREITGQGTFNTHEPTGDVLYGAEIMVDPEFRRRGIGNKFYEMRFELVRRLRLRFFAAGGRIPGYHDWQAKLSAKEYVDRVIRGRISDRVLSTQLRAGLKVRAVLPGYMRDPKSCDFATLLVWKNPEVERRSRTRRSQANRPARPRARRAATSARPRLTSR